MALLCWIGNYWGVTNRLANSDFSNNLEGFSINNSNALIDGKLNGINTLKFEVSGQTSSTSKIAQLETNK